MFLMLMNQSVGDVFILRDSRRFHCSIVPTYLVCNNRVSSLSHHLLDILTLPSIDSANNPSLAMRQPQALDTVQGLS